VLAPPRSAREARILAEVGAADGATETVEEAVVVGATVK
jgi:hypothetical protein